ncbi:MAG: hypothetical protein OXI60_07000 [Acidiferrobacterales bacterium]|nr:hypothetical protein [Acidiferrobacterales bacterium]
MLISILLLGILMGFRHALEADHLVAVLVLSHSRQTKAVVQGVVWGIGHTFTLLVVGVIFLSMDAPVPHQVADFLEFGVGVMLIVLGVDVFRRSAGRHFHIHAHRHSAGVRHIHLHAHDRRLDSMRDDHDHVHFGEIPIRTLVVGFIHGLAGSAALILLTLQTVQSFVLGIAYIVLFGLGSIMGMAALSVAIAVPFNRLRGHNSWQHRLKTAVGTVTVLFGASLVLNYAVNF